MSSKRGREEREDLVVGRHPDADVFLERSQEFLMRDEAENVLMLGLASARPEDALLLTVERERQLVMAALQSGRNMIVSRGPASAVEALVDHLTADGISLPGVTGPVEAAGRFSDLWCARTGQGARLHMSMRVYQITEVVVPERPSGVFRQAAASDLSLLAEWNEAFNVETRLEATRPGREVVTGPVGEGRLYVWEDGGPVSMAGWAGLTPGGVRIGYVYTPPKYRGRGYASACVADLSQLLLDRGRCFCALFTTSPTPSRTGSTHGWATSRCVTSLSTTLWNRTPRLTTVRSAGHDQANRADDGTTAAQTLQTVRYRRCSQVRE